MNIFSEREQNNTELQEKENFMNRGNRKTKKWLIPLAAMCLALMFTVFVMAEGEGMIGKTDGDRDGDGIVEGVEDSGNGAADGLVNGAESIVDGAVNGAENAVDGITDGAESIVDGITDGAEDIMDGTDNTADNGNIDTNAPDTTPPTDKESRDPVREPEGSRDTASTHDTDRVTDDGTVEDDGGMGIVGIIIILAIIAGVAALLFAFIPRR